MTTDLKNAKLTTLAIYTRAGRSGVVATGTVIRWEKIAGKGLNLFFLSWLLNK